MAKEKTILTEEQVKFLQLAARYEVMAKFFLTEAKKFKKEIFI